MTPNAQWEWSNPITRVSSYSTIGRPFCQTVAPMSKNYAPFSSPSLPQVQCFSKTAVGLQSDALLLPKAVTAVHRRLRQRCDRRKAQDVTTRWQQPREEHHVFGPRSPAQRHRTRGHSEPAWEPQSLLDQISVWEPSLLSRMKPQQTSSNIQTPRICYFVDNWQW
jgi:hypothetical protein